MHRIVWLFTWMVVASALAAEPVGDALRPGLRVKAKGRFADAGFVATRVKVHDPSDDDVEIAGPIAAIDDATDRFRIGGLWVLPDDGELDRASRRLARALETGDFVKAEGRLDGDGTLVADTLERPDDGAEPSVEGIVTAVEPASDGARVLRIGSIAVTLPSGASVEGAR